MSAAIMMSIGAFSKICQITTKTLRFYDEIGLLKPVSINPENGYRYYDVKQLQQVLLINKLKRYDFSLEEISAVIDASGDNLVLLPLMQKKRNQLQNKLQLYGKILSQMEHDLSALGRGIHLMQFLEKIEVQLVNTNEQRILSLRRRINVSEYASVIGKLYERVMRERLTPVGAPMTIYHDEEFNPENFDMEVAIPIKEKVDGSRILPAQQCAKATLIGPYSELNVVYTKIKEWIDHEGYVISSEPYEIYLSDPNKTDPEQLITDVYFPVSKSN